MARGRSFSVARRRLSAPERARDSRHALSASLQAPEETLLDVVDNLLNKGVFLDGDVVLALADVDLVYLKLSVLLSAADKVMSHASKPRRQPSARPRKR